MSGTFIVAAYAALISTIVALWQIGSEIHRRRTRVEVTTYLGEIRQAGKPPIRDLVMIAVTNNSDHQIRWVNGSWMVQGSKTRMVMQSTFPYGDPLPKVIPPHDSAQIVADLEVLRDFDLSKSVVACAGLADGKEIKSKPRVLRNH